jgi:hypothetical protein
MAAIPVTRAKVKESIRAELRTNIPLVVTFEKSDGEIRVMRCTTDLDQIPPSQWPDAKLTEQVNDEQSTTYRVFDLQKQQWRSFRLDSILEIIHGGFTYKIQD